MLSSRNSELAQHPELVEAVPAFFDLTLFRETEDADSGERYPLAGCRDAPKLAGVGDAQCPAGHHPDPFPDHVLYDGFDVREGGAELLDELLDIFGPRSRVVPSDWWERNCSAKISSAMSNFSSFQTSST